ncbi:MAG: FHA domain-containing protein [Planctomycetes bacterium]|nr:FHA domain-containing protein [Planctomycetota bacterium]
MTRETPSLLMLGPPQPGRAIPLSGTVQTVGRAQEADIVIEDTTISRVHARLTLRSDGLHLEDLGSRNGIRISGGVVKAGLVPPGGEFHIGKVRLRLQMPVTAVDDPTRTPAGGVPAVRPSVPAARAPVPAAPVPAAPVPAMPVPSAPVLVEPPALVAPRTVAVEDVAHAAQSARKGPFDWTTLALVGMVALLVTATYLAYQRDAEPEVVELILQPGEPRRIAMRVPIRRLEGPSQSYVLGANADPSNPRVLQMEALEHGESEVVLHLADGGVVRYHILVRGDPVRRAVETGTQRARDLAQGLFEQAQTAYAQERLVEARRLLREAAAHRPGGLLAVEISKIESTVAREIQRKWEEHYDAYCLYLDQGDFDRALAENAKIEPYLEPQTQDHIAWQDRHTRLQELIRRRRGGGR